MKLGILVVYLVPEENEGLLDLHLRQIEKYTQVPYTIFGCATRCSASARGMLLANPRVLLCECPPPAAAHPEHSHYLNELAQRAVASGVTHLVTLHVDSFPVRSDWVERLVIRLSSQCPLVVAELFYTACMMFNAEFWIRCSPKFSLTDCDWHSAEYARFVAMTKPMEHNGVGLLFRANSEGLSVSYLETSWATRNRRAGEIYDDAVFHLVGVARVHEEAANWSAAPLPSHHFRKVALAVVRAVTKEPMRLAVGRRFARVSQVLFGRVAHEQRLKQKRQAIAELVKDPAGYIDRIRSESRT